MARLDLRKMPASARRAFGCMLEPIREVERDPYALLERPRTVVERLGTRMAKMFERQAAGGGAEKMFKEMFGLLAAVGPAEWRKADAQFAARVGSELRRIARTPEGAQLVSLMAEANARVRNSVLLAMPHPVEGGLATLSVMSRLEDVRYTRGEERAQRLLDAAAEAAETQYRPYLEAVWKLVHFREGRVPPAPPQFGRLAQDLGCRLGGGSLLVEQDAAHIRNAIVHRRVIYVPKSHAVELRDLNGWSRTMTVAELELFTRRTLKMAGHLYPKASSAHMIEAFMRPLLPIMPEFSRALATEDRQALEALAPEMHRRMAAVWSDVAALYSAQRAA